MTRLILLAGLFAAIAIAAVPALERLASEGEPPTLTPFLSRADNDRRSPSRKSTAAGRRVAVRADDNGHFRIDAKVNGRRVEMLLDTGASAIALTDSDRRRLGLHVRDRDYTISVATANGRAAAAPVTLREVRVGTIRVRNVPAFVMKPGMLNKSLLGMTFLKRIESFNIAGDRLVMTD